MTTGAQPKTGTRTAQFVAWSFTMAATLAIGLVAAMAPVPQLTATANNGTTSVGHVPVEAHAGPPAAVQAGLDT